MKLLNDSCDNPILLSSNLINKEVCEIEFTISDATASVILQFLIVKLFKFKGVGFLSRSIIISEVCAPI